MTDSCPASGAAGRGSSTFASIRPRNSNEILSNKARKVAHFCSMRITQEVRDYAAAQGLGEHEALENGMAENCTITN